MADAAKPSDKLSLYSWYVIILLMLAYTVSFIDRQILSLLVEPMKKDLGISDTAMSLLQGLSFALFYTFLGLPIGRLADSHSRRGIIAAGIAVWSAMTALCGMVNNYLHLFLARMGVGVGEAALSPAAYSLITDTVDRRKLGTAISVYSMGIYLGGGLALILGGAIVQWAQSQPALSVPILGEIRAWQVVFLGVGIPGLLLAPLMYTIKEPARTLSKGAKGVGAPISEVSNYLKQNKGTILFHNFGVAFSALAGYAGMAWAPSYLIRTHGLSFQETGLYFGLIVLIFGAGGVFSGGFFADRWGLSGRHDAKLRIAMIGAFCGVLPGIIYPLVGNVWVALSFLALSTFMGNAMMGIAPAAIQEVVPANMRAQFSALYLFIVNLIGLGLGPTAVALVTDFVFGDAEKVNYSLAIVGPGAGILSGLCLFFCLPRFRTSLARLKEQGEG